MKTLSGPVRRCVQNYGFLVSMSRDESGEAGETFGDGTPFPSTF